MAESLLSQAYRGAGAAPLRALNDKVKLLAEERGPGEVFPLQNGGVIWEHNDCVGDAVAEFAKTHRTRPYRGEKDELLLRVCEQLSSRYEAGTGISYPAEQFSIGTRGCRGEISNLFDAAGEPGDAILMAGVGWEYAGLARKCHKIPYVVPPSTNDPFGLDPWTLWDLYQSVTITDGLKVGLIVVNNCHNPSGTVFTSDYMTRLYEMLKQTDASVPIMEDCINMELAHDGQYRSLATFSELRNRVIVVGAFSKSHGLCGDRIGFTTGNAEVMQDLIDARSKDQGGVSGFLLTESLHLMTCGECSTLPERITTRIRARKERWASYLKSSDCFDIFAGGATPYLTLDCSKSGKLAFDCSKELRKKTGVATVPGTMLFSGSTGSGFPSKMLRVCVMAELSDERIEQAAALVGKFTP